MATARRTGSNELIETYGSGQTYTVLNTWEAARDVDNVSLNQSPVLACLAAAYNDTTVMAGSTNDATRFRIIRPQASNFHTGIRGTGVRFESTTNAIVISVTETFSQIQDIAAKLTTNATQSRFVFSSTTSGKFIGCIQYASANAGSGTTGGFSSSIGGTAQAIDCLSDNVEGVGFQFSGATSFRTYNCTAIGGTIGFDGNSAAYVLTNCLAHGTSTNDFVGATQTRTYCASEDTTATGTGCRASQTFTFVNAGANDYHLSTSDAGAKDFGTDLSADGTFAFDDDIDRNTFSTWDIGFDSVDTVVADTGEWMTRLPQERSRSVVWVSY